MAFFRFGFLTSNLLPKSAAFLGSGVLALALQRHLRCPYANRREFVAICNRDIIALAHVE